MLPLTEMWHKSDKIHLAGRGDDCAMEDQAFFSYQHTILQLKPNGILIGTAHAGPRVCNNTLPTSAQSLSAICTCSLIRNP